MKMAKKLLAVVLAGVLALSVLTGCGSSSSKSTSIAEAMTDILKGKGQEITVKTDSDLNAKIKTMTTWKVDDNEDKDDEVKKNIMNLLGDTYRDQYVWFAMTSNKNYSNIAQAAGLLASMDDYVVNAPEGKDKETIKTYRIGTTTMTYEGEPVCIALIAAEAE